VCSSEQTEFDVAACRAHLRTRQARRLQIGEQQRQDVLRALRAAARSILPGFPCVRRAYLFGSALRPGPLRSTSYLDVAIEGTLNAEEYFALWRALERAVTDRPIDLVELDRDLRLAARVREEGELIYEPPVSDAEGRYNG
jgi:predicted nucleotidyltransferase